MIDTSARLPALPDDFPSSASMGQADEGGAGFTLLQLWHMVLAHVWLSIGIFAALVTTGYIVIKGLPKSYDATATLIVKADNVDPLAGRLSGEQSYSFLSTQIELINNSVMLQPVVDSLKLQEDPTFTDGAMEEPEVLNDIVVGKLRSILYVRQGEGGQLLYVSATSEDPEKAATIANAVADEYIRQTNQRINAPASERAGRYSEQLAELKAKADEAQARVAAFRERHSMADLGENGDIESAAVADLQAKLLAAQDERLRLEGLKGNGTDKTPVQESTEALSLRNRLEDLETEMAKALTTMGPRNPKVELLQKQIDAAREALNASVARAQAKARDLESKYQADLARKKRQLLDRRALEDQGEKLVQELRLAQESYSQALRGLDAVRFASQGNYQDVTLVSRAEPPIRPSKPNKLKLLAVVLAGSMALALGGPFAYELLLNRRIRCRDDLERHFRIVTLAEFGAIKPAPAG